MIARIPWVHSLKIRPDDRLGAEVAFSWEIGDLGFLGISPSGFLGRKKIPNPRDLGIGIPKNPIPRPPLAGRRKISHPKAVTFYFFGV